MAVPLDIRRISLDIMRIFFHGKDGQALQWWSPHPWRYPRNVALRDLVGTGHSLVSMIWEGISNLSDPGILTAPMPHPGGLHHPEHSASLGLENDPNVLYPFPSCEPMQTLRGVGTIHVGSRARALWIRNHQQGLCKQNLWMLLLPKAFNPNMEIQAGSRREPLG